MRFTRLAVLTGLALLGVGLWMARDVGAIYNYYKIDGFGSVDGTYWQLNGSLSASGVLTGAGNGGALIAKTGPPTSPGEYEIHTILKIPQSGGTFVHFIRATQDAKTTPSTGTYYSVEVVNPTYTVWNGLCSATLVANRRSGGVVTNLWTSTIACHDNLEMRTIYSNGKLNTYIDKVSSLLVIDAAIASGNPGVGVTGAPAANGIDIVSLGAKDTQVPQTISAQSIAALPLSNEIDLQWTEPTDNPAGTGVGVTYYWVSRRLASSGTWDFVGQPRTPELKDPGVVPGTTYVYSIAPMDYHWNIGVATEVTVTTAPAGSVDGRRTGIRGDGSYWGSNGENIDTRSGNLNFTLPLLAAKGRNGQAAGVSLNYNSQNWRRHNGVTYKLGQDAGYGYGWKVLAGSVTPFWKNYFEIGHWVFTDNTGAEYRLDQNNGYNVWTGKDTYVTYVEALQRLYFNDGSWWNMHVISSGNEQDAGTRYPSQMGDVNGNLITFYYWTGVNSPVANSSSRIAEIEDVRAVQVTNPTRYRTYTFNYTTYAGETLPHLTSITTDITDGESYSFSYAATTLQDPFTGASYGPGRLLTGITKTGVNLTHSFEYGTNGAGELTKAIYPYGGWIRWVHRSFTYTGSRMLREVNSRYFGKAPGAAEDTFQFSFDDSGDAGRSFHYWSNLAMGAAARRWTFELSGTYAGRTKQLDMGANATITTTPFSRSVYTWSTDAGGHPYVGQDTSTSDVGQSFAKTMTVTQALDQYGNLTQRQVYKYDGSLSRTYNMTYVTTQAYLDRFIRNRLSAATMTPAGQSAQSIAWTTYDSNGVLNRAGLRQHDSAAYGIGMNTRGNATVQWQYGGETMGFKYDITGLTYEASQGSKVVSATPAMNNVVPGTMTVNGNGALQHTMNWNSFLGMTQDAGPNGATSSYSYDQYARPQSTTSALGAITQFAYNDAARESRAVTNGKVVKTTMDGFGRPVKVETGTGGLTGAITVISTVETEYEACACTPMGKVKRVSQPYAPGGTKYWTTYNYDHLGRTTSVVLPSGMGTTSYLYEGNTVKVTDPAGKWKKFTSNELGELVQVNEPNPAGGADYVTSYTYNFGGQLTGVSMPRGGVTQTRTFVYNSLGKMTSETNPETGTRTYYYNGDGTLDYRVDAKGQKVKYVYDTYQRVTEIQRHPTQSGPEDTCQKTKMYYDSNGFEGTVSTLFNPVNLSGRLAVTEYSVCAPAPGGPAITRTVREMFSYTSAGLVAKKRFQLTRPYDTAWSASDAADMEWTYDQEGKVQTIKYPSTKYWNGSTAVTNVGPTVNYQYDSAARMTGATETYLGSTNTLVSAMLYNAHGAMTQMKHHGNGGATVTQTESREYNILGQLTRISAGSGGGQAAVDLRYTYSSTQNNGKITQLQNVVSGETVVYQYDSLQRLTSAVKTGGTAWSRSYGYDGFGNLTQMGPSSYPVNGATNRLTGFSYDANGNQLNGSTSAYDIENRLQKWDSSGEEYRYGPDNRRVFKVTSTEETYYFFGLNGRAAAELEVVWEDVPNQPRMVLSVILQTGGSNAPRWYRYVGLRRVGWHSVGVDDHLGGGAGRMPYGEDSGGRFGTHEKDSSTGLHYADQRYYMSTRGRFLTADPYRASGGPGDPGSWNRYAYTRGDPVGRVDSEGLQDEPTFSVTVYSGTTPASYFSEYEAGLIRTFWLRSYVREQSLVTSTSHLGDGFQSGDYPGYSARMHTYHYRQVALDKIGQLSEECHDYLRTRTFAGESLLARAIRGIGNANILESGSYEGQLLMTDSQAAGTTTQTPIGMTVGEFGAGLAASGAGAGVSGNALVIAPGFTAAGFSAEFWVHEGLHLGLNNRSDLQVASLLGIGDPTWTDTPGDQRKASSAISDFLNNKCQK